MVTAFFWIVKALTTAMGESTSDFLVHAMIPQAAVVLGGIAFAIALYLQLSKDRYVPWAYWLAVAMVGVFGTMGADVLHVGFGVPYIASTIFFAVVLPAVFRTWYRSEGTLSIHSIRTPRRELFYWAAVVATFALGTAAGDLTAVTFGLGYFGSGLSLRRGDRDPGARLLPLRDEPDPRLLVRLRRDPPARRLIRGLARQSRRGGGLGLGTGPVSLVLAAVIAGFVAYLSVTGKDTPEEIRAPHRRKRDATIGAPEPLPEEA